MKIRIIKNTIPVGFSWLPPKEVEVKEELGQMLCEDGFAILIDTPKPKKKRAVSSNTKKQPTDKSGASKGASKGNS